MLVFIMCAHERLCFLCVGVEKTCFLPFDGLQQVANFKVMHFFVLHPFTPSRTAFFELVSQFMLRGHRADGAPDRKLLLFRSYVVMLPSAAQLYGHRPRRCY